ncbi:unnamed protein product [Rotaria magnacalcarata]|uniref:EF-hand domain-containing protein n=1 Tax=Rotaria magnacalcarata TaxID=392030 RepID=A0A8S2J4Y6_9BILA|nr:unnamed protein product [Rotaria magnacalcarata]
MSEQRSRSSPGNVTIKAFDNISPEELEELREAFRVFDQNGDGSITLSELRIVLDQMGLDPSEEELQDMIREVDADQSGSISFVEFVVLQATGDRPTDEDVLEMIAEADIDGDGRSKI